MPSAAPCRSCGSDREWMVCQQASLSALRVPKRLAGLEIGDCNHAMFHFCPNPVRVWPSLALCIEVLLRSSATTTVLKPTVAYSWQTFASNQQPSKMDSLIVAGSYFVFLALVGLAYVLGMGVFKEWCASGSSSGASQRTRVGKGSKPSHEELVRDNGKSGMPCHNTFMSNKGSNLLPSSCWALELALVAVCCWQFSSCS